MEQMVSVSVEVDEVEELCFVMVIALIYEITVLLCEHEEIRMYPDEKAVFEIL